MAAFLITEAKNLVRSYREGDLMRKIDLTERLIGDLTVIIEVDHCYNPLDHGWAISEAPSRSPRFGKLAQGAGA